ncbi:HEPN domain-containing protein [Candidatus Desantisbacteria bacterium]|nr:HEPN domain-containing protein [Candidatus Desantisbacteria bacterium]
MTKNNIEIIKNMIIKACEKLKTGKIDFDNQRYDDSVSRAYYAVYHSISAVLVSKKLHFSSHSQTIGAFNKEFIKTKEFPESFTKIIQKLFIDRQIGDYDFDNSIDKNRAQEALNETEKIIETCKKYLITKNNLTADFWPE